MNPTLPTDALNIFCDSFERVKAGNKFLDLFYEKFLGSSEEVSRLFEGVSMSRLKTMLQITLYWPMLACDGNATSVDRLMKLGVLHRGKGVMEHHYKLWIDSLMSTVEECDENYTVAVDRAWREVMSVGIKIMLGQMDSAALALSKGTSISTSAEPTEE
jgi:hemoglobin-like flavoprotein